MSDDKMPVELNYRCIPQDVDSQPLWDDPDFAFAGYSAFILKRWANRSARWRRVLLPAILILLAMLVCVGLRLALIG